MKRTASSTPVGGEQLDFHSPEFNRIDDLNDFSGNYLLFESLEGVVTSHERHQIERTDHMNTVSPRTEDRMPVRNMELGSEEEKSLPTRHYAPGPRDAAIAPAIANVPEMQGQPKPRFLSFNKTHCFYGRSRARDCRQCLDVCPLGAIQSIERNISIDHHLCQGCGGCALVCPADAIQMTQPSPEQLLTSIRNKLETLSSAASCRSILMITDLKPAHGQKSREITEAGGGDIVCFDVEQIAHVGLEMLLACLACGAEAVLVACASRNPQNIRDAVETQAEMARAILRGLGLSEALCRFTLVTPEGIDSEIAALKTTLPDRLTRDSRMAPVTSSAARDTWQDRWQAEWSDKRALVRGATQHLYDLSGAKKPSLPLPVGSPFGAVAVNPVDCTLCMACAVACPSGALSAAGEMPRLLFRESRCHQCGLCEEICPEGAIRLLPRLLCNPEEVEAGRRLHEAEALRCIECGAPLASPAMIARIREKLTGHWMYADERQLRRLQMCRTCSARDALASQKTTSRSVR